MMAQSRMLTFFFFFLFLWFLLIVLISGLHQSGASLSSTWSMQKLSRGHHPDNNASHSKEVSPSPSPSVLPDPEKVHKMRRATLLYIVPPVPSPSNNELALTGELCPGDFRTCHVNNFSTCLQYARNARESFLIILKIGRGILPEVNVTFLPSNATFNETLPAARLMKVNVTEGIQGSSSIVVNVGGEECVIDMKLERHQLLHPSHGILTCLVIGVGVGAWGCYVYRFRGSRRRITGLVRTAYQRVNVMVAPSRPSCAIVASAKDIETGKAADSNSWNKRWGENVEDRDEGKTVAACLQKKHGGNSLANIDHKAD